MNRMTRAIRRLAAAALAAVLPELAANAATSVTTTFALRTTTVVDGVAVWAPASAADIHDLVFEASNRIILTTPSGTETVLKAAGASALTAAFNPFETDPGTGGTWKLTNDGLGTATFTIRAGTLANPYVIGTQADLDAKVQADETSFFYVKAGGGANDFTTPDGYLSYQAGDNLFLLTRPADPDMTISKSSATSSTAHFYLDTTGETDGATTTRTLASPRDLFPILLHTGVLTLTSPVDATFAVQKTMGSDEYLDPNDWRCPALGTWVFSLETEGQSYKAVFNLGERSCGETDYHYIAWRKNDGTAAWETYLVKDGETPHHADLARATDASYAYTFNGWSPSVATATADATYTAQWTTAPTAAQVGSTYCATLAEAVTAAGTTGANTILLRTANSEAITLGAVGNVLKIDTSSAAYSGTVKTSVTNAKVVSSKSGNVTTYTVKWDFSKAKVTVGGTWTYDGTQKKPAVGNLTVTFNNATLAQSGNWSIGAYGANVNAGNGTVTVTGAGAYDGTASGTFTIGKATLTVTAKAKTITYGDAPANAGVTYDGFVNGETENVLGGSLAYDYTYSQYGKPGGYAITPKGLTSDNYALTFVKGTLTVNKAALTATAEDKSVTYGAAAPAYTVKYSGWKGSDGVGRLSTAPTATAAYTTTTAVGTYDITVSGGASDYYTLAYVKGKLTVTKAASKVTVTAKSGLVYSGAAQDLVTQSGLSGGTIAYTLDGAAGTAAIPTGTVPKTYTVAWKVTGDANHGDTSGSTTVTISGTVAGAKTITLGSGVTVSIPSGVTVTVSEAQAATVPANGTVTVAANAARAEVTGAATVAKAGGVTLGTGGKAVYLYKNQTELDAIKAIAAPAYTGGKLKIKAVAQ